MALGLVGPSSAWLLPHAAAGASRSPTPLAHPHAALQCSEPWMAAGNFCAAACRRCPAGGAGVDAGAASGRLGSIDTGWRRLVLAGVLKCCRAF